MPIYEFYCSDCHTVYNFLSKVPNTTKSPTCPTCDRPTLERRVSAFAIGSGGSEKESADADDLPQGIDEARLERVMSEMSREVEGIDDENPRQMAGVMRKLFEGTGLKLGPGMEEAIRRMEAGEDPDKIEEEMGDQLEGDEGLLFDAAGGGLKGLRRKLEAPHVDPTLYEM